MPYRRGLSQSGNSLIDQLAAAIQRMEGWAPGTISYRNNNPGNLRAGVGQTGMNGGFAVFPDYATGLAALDNQIQLNIDKGLTLNEFFAGKPGVYPGYAPASDNNQPNVYAANVAQWTGIDPNVPLQDLMSGGGGPGDTSGTGDSSFPGDTSGMASLSTTAWIALGLAAAGLAWVVFSR